MLGMKEIESDYFKSIKDILGMKSCVGAVGGKPNKSLYFVGYEGEELIYLDPHFV